MKEIRKNNTFRDGPTIKRISSKFAENNTIIQNPKRKKKIDKINNSRIGSNTSRDGATIKRISSKFAKISTIIQNPKRKKK
jgi:hypothetical protein